MQPLRNAQICTRSTRQKFSDLHERTAMAEPRGRRITRTANVLWKEEPPVA